MRYGKLFLPALLVLAASSVQAQNLVTNPGFETGDFTGWTLTGGTYSEVDSGIGHDSDYAASLGNIPPDTVELSQTLSTQVGQAYQVSFFAQTPEFGNPPGTPNSLTVYFDGNWVDGPFTVPETLDYHVFEAYSYRVTASSSSALLRFVVSNDPDYTQLDDISVTAVPEPGTLALLLAGGCGGIWLRRRRR
jgi:hypothetical protein